MMAEKPIALGNLHLALAPNIETPTIPHTLTLEELQAVVEAYREQKETSEKERRF